MDAAKILGGIKTVSTFNRILLSSFSNSSKDSLNSKG